MMRLLADEEATGKAKEVFADIEASFEMVPNLFRAKAAVDPEWLESNWRRQKKIMLDEGVLDRKTKELIAMVVSLVNRCEYCSLAHETTALMAGATEREVVEAKGGHRAIR